MVGGSASDPAASAFADDVEHGANLYSLLQALEYLERAYIAGDAAVAEYERECAELLSLCRIMEEATPNVFVDFAKEFKLRCPLALNRLSKGVPGTRDRADGSSPQRNEKYLMFELSEHFITLVDALKLGSTLVEELFPLVHDLNASLSCVESLVTESGDDLSGVAMLDRLRGWYSRLEGMAAYENLSENDARQLMMETEAAYGSFKAFLRSR